MGGGRSNRAAKRLCCHNWRAQRRRCTVTLQRSAWLQRRVAQLKRLVLASPQPRDVATTPRRGSACTQPAETLRVDVAPALRHNHAAALRGTRAEALRCNREAKQRGVVEERLQHNSAETKRGGDASRETDSEREEACTTARGVLCPVPRSSAYCALLSYTAPTYLVFLGAAPAPPCTQRK